MEAEVIEDKGAEKITIKFVDGTIITNRDRYSFLTQTINNPNYNRHSIVGQKAFMRCCLEAEVIEDFGYNDITVRFSNGVIKKHCPRQSFRNKKLTPFTRR
jgi:diphthamide synthase subunit DPH2